MREYKKPTVQVVNLRSAEDIAASYKGVAGTLINQYLRGSSYAVTKYDLSQGVSVPANSEVNS